MLQKTQKLEIPIWYVTTLLLTGLLLCLHFIWKNAGEYSISFTQFGPMTATFLMFIMNKDGNALFFIKNGLRFRKENIIWYVLTVLIAFVLIGISSLLLTLFFGIPYQAWNGTPIFYLVNFFAILLGSIGEEIGWRGYLMPAFNKKFTPFVSSVMVGGLWGFWHLNYAGNMVFWLLFIITTMELSIIFTFFLQKSKGNIWTAILLHTAFNLANRIFVLERFEIYLLLIEIVLFGMVSTIILILNKNSFFNKCNA